MADWSTEAEDAIRAFEAITGLVVSIHDHVRGWSHLLPATRFGHTHPACALAKEVRQDQCIACDYLWCAAESSNHRRGFSKICHIGAVELVVPWHVGNRLMWVVFAGALRPGSTTTALVAPSSLPRAGPWVPTLARAPAGDDARMRTLLELLRQLAARLAAIQTGAEAALSAAGPQPRDVEIRRFVQEHHSRPIHLADLARRLGLSTSRAGHAVREATGQGFLDLLNETRLRSAAGLLRHTGLGIPQVAVRSGFANLSNFHRRFRIAFGCTPRLYRAQSEG